MFSPESGLSGENILLGLFMFAAKTGNIIEVNRDQRLIEIKS